jgi:hypothetical protein
MAEVHKKDDPSGLILKLSAPALTELRRGGISARPTTSIVYQEKSKRWLIFGEESGGSIKPIGHYVGFVGVEADGLVLSLPIQSLVPNGSHRRVYGTHLARIEMYRYEQSCDLSITLHALLSPGEGRRPRFRRIEIFLARNGILTADNPVPLFFNRSGELVDLPSQFLPAIIAATKGVQCLNCKHSHLVGVAALPMAEVASIAASFSPVESVREEPVVAPSKARARRAIRKVVPNAEATSTFEPTNEDSSTQQQIH